MTLLSFDVTKRNDAARKSSRRAEIKLLQEMNKAGGLEDEMRYQIATLKREQTILKKELHTLKFESRLSARRASDSLASLSSDSFYFSYGEKNLLPRRRSSDYGKNFFGYFSTPGSKKVIKKSTRELENSLDNYCKKIDELMHEENIGRKLDYQQKENKSVKDKLDSWMMKNSSRNRDFKQQQVLQTDEIKPDLVEQKIKAINGLETKDKPKISSGETTSRSSPTQATDSSLVLPPIHKSPEPATSKPVCLHNDYTQKPDSAKSGDDKNKPNVSRLKQQSNELIFDADLYAPDGRMRMAHRMPEFHLAFEQARKTRYLRTREKRDFEVQLTVNEIFDTQHQTNKTIESKNHNLTIYGEMPELSNSQS